MADLEILVRDPETGEESWLPVKVGGVSGANLVELEDADGNKALLAVSEPE